MIVAEEWKDWIPNAQWLKNFRRKVLTWYQENSRTLAWRGTHDPYKVWVSEIMLQQTTTAAVDAYYRRFMERFPNVESLATAELSEVQRLWEGLGYYRRARQLHLAAQVMIQEHGEKFPQTFSEVLALPGIGRYTAGGAILSIAYGQRFPILEANTIRLHARLLAYPDDPTRGMGNKILWFMAETVLPKNGIGHFNQALMDIGSLVCLPKNPHCLVCPVFNLCESAKHCLQAEIPAIKKEKIFEQRTELALVVEKNGKYLLIQYPDGGRWGGLWDFPRHVIESQEKIEKNQQILKDFCRITGYQLFLKRQIMVIRHSVTRFKIMLYVYQADLNSDQIFAEYKTCWLSKKEIYEFPLNTTARKIADSL